MYVLPVWLIIVTTISLLPLGGGPPTISGMDKVVHFLTYAVTCALIFRAIGRGAVPGGRFKARALAAPVVLASAYGLMVEVLQGAVEYRDFSLWDAAFNCLGALAAAVLIAASPAVRTRVAANKFATPAGNGMQDKGG